jgi:2-polyprenyl-3-methyl-5-hydroxy-6-metoxy-1,4-benzoquinol methylase
MQVVNPDAFSRYRRELERHLLEAGVGVGHTPDRIADALDARLRRTRGEAFAGILAEHVGLSGQRLLDVGSGFGELVVACLSRGAQATGIDPDPERVHISRLLLESLGLPPVIEHASGEALPFRDVEFDIVTSQHVLEHVSHLDKVVAEMVRVTRPGGRLLVSVPNYLFPYEGHYKMKWFPLTPKPLGKRILQLSGRNPDFLLRHVHYTTYPRMMKLWRQHGLTATNITRELVQAGRHESAMYRRPLVRALALKLSLFPTITWLLRKPHQPETVTGDEPRLSLVEQVRITHTH